MATLKNVPSWKPKAAPATIVATAATPPKARNGPRNEKLRRVTCTITVRAVNASRVTVAAAWMVPGAKNCAMSSMGTKISPSATT